MGEEIRAQTKAEVALAMVNVKSNGYIYCASLVQI